MTPEETRALIAEADRDIELWGEDSYGRNGLVRRMRDALEGTLTEPDGDAVARVRAKLDRIPDSDAVTLDKADVRSLLSLSRAAAPEEPDDEPCKEETHSWSHYRPEQIDSYWIRCTRLGSHEEHYDSNTGLRWGEV